MRRKIGSAEESPSGASGYLRGVACARRAGIRAVRQESSIDVIARASGEAESDRSATPWLALLLAVSTLLHLWLAIRYPLAEDEAGYWDWSRHLDSGYYDQGPMIALVIRAGTSIFGYTELGVRIGSVVLSLLTQVIVYLLAKDALGRKAGLLSAAILAATPLAIAGGFLATYDVPMVAFWALALLFGFKASVEGSRLAWIGAGLAFGLGLLSKYSMALFAPCMLLYLLSTGDGRKQLKSPWPWLSLALGIAVFSPNLLWLARHDWIPFRHIGVLGSSTLNRPFWERTANLIGTQAAILGPILFVLLTVSLFWAWRRRRPHRAPIAQYKSSALGQSKTRTSSLAQPRDPKSEFQNPKSEIRIPKSEIPGAWVLFCFSAPVLLFFLATTLKSKVLANWPAFGWLAAIPLLAAWALESNSKGRRTVLAAACGLSLVMTLLVVFPESLSYLGVRMPQGWTSQIDRMYGGEELGAAADRELRKMEADTGGIVTPAGTTYQETSRLAFSMQSHPRTVCLFIGSRSNQYMFWNRDSGIGNGANMLVAIDDPPVSNKAKRLAEAFERIEWVALPVQVSRGPLRRTPVRTYYLARCFGLRNADKILIRGFGEAE